MNAERTLLGVVVCPICREEADEAFMLRPPFSRRPACRRCLEELEAALTVSAPDCRRCRAIQAVLAALLDAHHQLRPPPPVAFDVELRHRAGCPRWAV